jgi:hypothetical protein
MRRHQGLGRRFSSPRPTVLSQISHIRGVDCLRDPLEDHRRLNAVTATKALAAGRGRRDGVKSISKRGLSIECPLQLSEVARPRTPQLLLEDDLKNDITCAMRSGARLGASYHVLFDSACSSGYAAACRLLLICVRPVLAIPPTLLPGPRTVVVPARWSVSHGLLPFRPESPVYADQCELSLGVDLPERAAFIGTPSRPSSVAADHGRFGSPVRGGLTHLVA